MDDTWLSIEDDTQSSASDSDAIDSETEAELYSTIHYEENLDSHVTQNVSFQNSELIQNNNSAILSEKSNVLYLDENLQTSNVKNDLISKKQINDLQHKIDTPNQNAFLNKVKKNLNSAKKLKMGSSEKSRKSDLNLNNSDIDLNGSYNHKSLINVQNKIDRSSCSKQNSKKASDTIVINSSDSDDNIWTEPTPEKTDFKTNLFREVDTICVNSSDSDVEPPNSTFYMKRDSILRNLSMPNIKMGEKPEGLWHINNEDLYRQRKYSRRYHDSIDTTCTNCNRKGHNFRTCPVPKVMKCFICGGTHPGSKCKNRICSNCFGFGHDHRRCRMGPNPFFCEMCSMRGHTQENCPDLWRRYHLTTDPAKIVKGKRVKEAFNIYCWNCGQHGHFGSVCQYRNSLSTWPCVISYDDPKGMLRERLHSIRNRHNRFGHLQYEEDLNNIGERRRNKRLKQRRRLHMAEPFMPERMAMEENLSRRQKLKKVHKVVKEKDFSRTPKQKLPKESDDMPESVELLKKRELKNKRRNRRRRQQKKRLLGQAAERKSIKVELK